MTFVPFSSLVSAFKASLLEAASAPSCFAVSDLKVDIPAEVKVVNGQVLVQLAGAGAGIDAAALTRLSFSLGATCAPEAMPKPSAWSASATGTAESLYGLASSQGAVWACGKGGVVLRSEDGARTFAPEPLPAPARLFAVAVTGNGMVVVAGADGALWILPPGGGGWVPVADFSKGHLNALWSQGARVLAVGSAGAIFLSDTEGKSWKGMQPFTSHNLHALWSSPDGALFAAGANGAVGVSMDTGESWSALPSPSSKHLFGGWAASKKEIFVAGEGGRVHRWDGSGAWSQLASGTTESLYALWGSSPTELWAAGRNGTLLRSTDGASFTRMDLGITASLHAIAPAGAGALALCGTGGLAGRLDVSLLQIA